MTGSQERRLRCQHGHWIGHGHLQRWRRHSDINNLVYSGLTTPSTASHIHGPGAPGVSAGCHLSIQCTDVCFRHHAGVINGTITLITTLMQRLIHWRTDHRSSGRPVVREHPRQHVS